MASFVRVKIDKAGIAKAALLPKQLRQVIFATHLDLWNDTVAVEEHPVDTGFARASWWAQANNAPVGHPNQPSPEETYPTSPSPDPVAVEKSIGGTLSIVNNAAYIRRLEYDGHSPQGSGWVNRAASRYNDNLRKNLARMA